jgi:hypothetical protein
VARKYVAEKIVNCAKTHTQTLAGLTEAGRRAVAELAAEIVEAVTLLTPAQNLIEILPGTDRTMKVLIAGRGLGKAAVVVGDEVAHRHFDD